MFRFDVSGFSTCLAAEDSPGEELTQMVQEYVRNEIALQRSDHNSSLLIRTRDLITNSARHKVANAIGPSQLTEAVNWPGISSSSALQTSGGTAEAYFLQRQSYSFQTGSKRTASATTTQHLCMALQVKQTKVCGTGISAEGNPSS